MQPLPFAGVEAARQQDGNCRIKRREATQARALYASEDPGLELSNTVYALDSTTIDLCLSMFPWAHFRSTKTAVKMHTLPRKTRHMAGFVDASVKCCFYVCFWWAVQGSNLRPLPCEGNALPLS